MRRRVVMARILVVEDEPTIAMVLRDDLELEGHVVEVVADGETAERAALERRHDLMILDVMLPKKDGLALCRAVRGAGV
jgi:two-component system alkaline phosphatase synthesis response regulator PhoP